MHHAALQKEELLQLYLNYIRFPFEFVQKEADLMGNKALAIGKEEDVSENDLMDVSLSTTSAPIQGVWNIVVSWVARETGKEIAREAMLRWARGELKMS